MDAIPSGSTVTVVVDSFKVSSQGAGAQNMTPYVLIAAFGEKTVTWNNQPG